MPPDEHAPLPRERAGEGQLRRVACALPPSRAGAAAGIRLRQRGVLAADDAGLAGLGDAVGLELHRSFVSQQRLGALRYVLSPALGVAYGVSKLPFAALVDHRGILRARGLVNTREHLESLLEAMELGVGSIQEFLERESAELRLEVSAGGGG